MRRDSEISAEASQGVLASLRGAFDVTDHRPPQERFALFDAVNQQLDADLIDRVERYANRRCVMLERAGLWADSDELTHAAIDATLWGQRTWDPARYSLYHHLCGVIGSQTTSMMKHGHKFRHERMGADLEGDADPTEAAASLQRPRENPETTVVNADLADRTVAALLSLAEANNDNQVVAIVNAYADGITERADVAAHLGIALRKYDHARKRLMRLVAKLTDETQVDQGASHA